MSWWRKLLGIEAAPDWQELMAAGAQIIDVRSAGEFSGGHYPGSKNIPLPNLGQQLNKLRKDQPVITCCASGMRSAAARDLLRSKGFTQVYNGGSWSGLASKLKK